MDNNLNTSNALNTLDLISRQAAITALCKRCGLVSDEDCPGECNDIKILRKLPSAHPEQSKELKILADALDGTPLYFPCDKLGVPDGWCAKRCKWTEPVAECWLKYAEVTANE